MTSSLVSEELFFLPDPLLDLGGACSYQVHNENRLIVQAPNELASYICKDCVVSKPTKCKVSGFDTHVLVELQV